MIAETRFLQTTDSTNRVAYSMAEKGAVHGSAVIADEQLGGRGRLGKTWQSPRGKGLYCSFVVRPSIGVSDYPLITMSAGVGVALALEAICDIEFGLKWPNDIYRRGKKCGGILVESSPLTNQQADHFAIVGVGINVDTGKSDFSPEIIDKATSLYLESGKIIDKQHLFEKIREQLLNQLQILEMEGFAPILKQWKEKDISVGHQLQWLTPSAKVVRGVSLGPDEKGRLHIRDKKGRIHEVLSGEINLVDTVMNVRTRK